LRSARSAWVSRILRGVQAVLGEGAFVDLRQAHLADGGGGLQLVHLVRALGPAQALHAAAMAPEDTSTTSLPAFAQCGDLARPVADGVEIEPGAVVGDEGGADLDDCRNRLMRLTNDFQIAQDVHLACDTVSPGKLFWCRWQSYSRNEARCNSRACIEKAFRPIFLAHRGRASLRIAIGSGKGDSPPSDDDIDFCMKAAIFPVSCLNPMRSKSERPLRGNARTGRYRLFRCQASPRATEPKTRTSSAPCSVGQKQSMVLAFGAQGVRRVIASFKPPGYFPQRILTRRQPLRAAPSGQALPEWRRSKAWCLHH
jgi:hypothetical protein